MGRLENKIALITGAARGQGAAEAARFGSIDNMRSMEQGEFFGRKNSRMRPKDPSNPDSFKVRRARAGGYRDDFTPAQLAELDELLLKKLSPTLGYGPTGD